MSSLTTEYNFIKPDASDNISPAPFNQNFDKIESLIKSLSVDYVEAQGTSGVWQYRRWHSGIAECWIEEYTVSSVTMTTPYGNNNLYTGYFTSPGQYPFSFLYPPIVMVTFSNRGVGTVQYSFPIWSMPDGTTTKCPRFQGIDQTKGTIANVKLGIYVKGTWK